MPDTPDDIVCFELGSGQPPWVGSSDSLNIDREAIKRLIHDGLIEVAEWDGDSHIAGVDRVGFVQLPSGRRLVIRSKIESLVLLEWLVYPLVANKSVAAPRFWRHSPGNSVKMPLDRIAGGFHTQ
jgi:hypothetical protein